MRHGRGAWRGQRYRFPFLPRNASSSFRLALLNPPRSGPCTAAGCLSAGGDDLPIVPCDPVRRRRGLVPGMRMPHDQPVEMPARGGADWRRSAFLPRTMTGPSLRDHTFFFVCSDCRCTDRAAFGIRLAPNPCVAVRSARALTTARCCRGTPSPDTPASHASRRCAWHRSSSALPGQAERTRS